MIQVVDDIALDYRCGHTASLSVFRGQFELLLRWDTIYFRDGYPNSSDPPRVKWDLIRTRRATVFRETFCRSN